MAGTDRPGLPCRAAQVSTLLQLGLQLCLRSALQLPEPVCTSGPTPAPSPSPSPAPGAAPAQWPPVGPPADAELSVSELSLFHVSGLAGAAGASCLSLSLQGVTLLGGPARSCLLYAPPGGASAAAIDLLQLSGPAALAGLAGAGSGRQQASSGSGRRRASSSAGAGAASAATTSLLIKGTSVALDPGNLSLTWLQQLLAFLQPPAPGPEAAAAAAGSEDPPPSGTFVLNVEDLALRYEPSSAIGARAGRAGWRCCRRCTTACAMAGCCWGLPPRSWPAAAGGPPGSSPIGHGGQAAASEVAAALLVEGIHFCSQPGAAQQEVRAAPPPAAARCCAAPLQALLPAPAAQAGPLAAAPPQVLLHSLGLHIAAAARRGAGWALSHPRDLHGSSLPAAGYHCVAQEGRLRIAIRTVQSSGAGAGAGAVSGPGPEAPEPASCVETEVSNHNLVGSLTAESAGLLALLLQQLDAVMVANSPPPPPPSSNGVHAPMAAALGTAIGGGSGSGAYGARPGPPRPARACRPAAVPHVTPPPVR
jgi:hypothetical protein